MVRYSISDSEHDRKYYKEKLDWLLAHPMLNDFSDVIIAMHKAGVSINGCGCCDSPYFYFDGDYDDRVPCITYDTKTNEGYIDGVSFTVVIK